MAYHIGEYRYSDKLNLNPKLFFSGLCELNYDSLTTLEQYETYKELREKDDLIYEQKGLNHHYIYNEAIYRQYPIQYYSDSYPFNRVYVGFQEKYHPDAEFSVVLRAQGFQVEEVKVVFMGNPDWKMLIVGEKNVDMKDAVEWAKKFDIRDWELSKCTPPVDLPSRTTRYNRATPSVDTQELITYCYENSFEAAQRHFGQFANGHNIGRALHRLWMIKENKRFVQ